MSASEAGTHALICPLHLGGDGLTVAVKDCIDIAGEVTSCGSAVFRNTAPVTAHAEVVETLLVAGCRIIGKTNMHELAFGMTGVNEVFGTPVNPRWPDRIPGGSSSGSAVAAAAGLCDFAVGTDTGGSIRQPAICCGIYGIKPSFGRISRKGCHPAASSLDCVGVMARTAPMLSRAMAAIDPGFIPATLDTPLRIARVRVKLPPSVGEHLIHGLMEYLPETECIELDGLMPAFEAGMTIIGAETASAFGALIDTGAPLGADVRTRIEKARGITPEMVAGAEAVRQSFTAEVNSALAGVDALITPALPVVPPTLDEAKDPATILPLTRFLRPFNLTGHPAIVLPCTKAGLPMGLQIVGRKGDDARLCAIAEWMAKTMPDLHKEDAIS